MHFSIFFRLVRTPQWRCLRTTRQRWPSCGIRGATRAAVFVAGRLMIFCARRSAIPPLFCLSSSWGSTPCWRILFFRLNPILGSVWTPETVSVSAASEKVAGVARPVRNLTNSPLLTLFFSVPQFQCSWDRGSSQTRGWVAGVCFSSLCAYSCDSVNCSARPLGSC